MEYFTYMFNLLRGRGYGHIKIFGSGGGVILPQEIQALHDCGITRIYSPDDGRKMSLQGMINDLLQKCDFPLLKIFLISPRFSEKEKVLASLSVEPDTFKICEILNILNHDSI